MTDLVQKLGTTILVTLVLEIASYLSNPFLSMAQETERYVPPRCQGNPSVGRVRCSYSNGDYYIGGLANGVPSGRGVYIDSEGNRYEGEFRNGLPNGEGVLILIDNNRYEGQFRNGFIISGRAISAEGRYDGQFRPVSSVDESGNLSAAASLPVGIGRFTFSNGDRYEGEYFEGAIFGNGVLIRTDGTRCVGEFYNNQLDARAICTYANGSRYEGELRGGVPEGQGTLIGANGLRFQGAFRAGKPFNPAKQP